VCTTAEQLCDAAQFGHVDVIKALVADGANMMASAEDGSTPLHLAVIFGTSYGGSIGASKVGVDLDAKKEDGHTALDVSVLLVQMGPRRHGCCAHSSRAPRRQARVRRVAAAAAPSNSAPDASK
jgi:hypothetical protein